MRNRKKKNRIFLLLIVILTITIGFALLSTTLFINGTASIKGNTWDIHWDDESINVASGSVAATIPNVSTATTAKDTVSFEVELEMPGDFFEFEIDAVNEGTVDGALDLAENWITYTIGGESSSLPSYMNFSVTYDDGTIPQSGDVLEKRVDQNTPGRQTYKIRVEFKSNIEELPSNPQPVNIEVELPYVQHKETCTTPVSFSEDSWETIACNVRKGNTSVYNVGDTKSVDMGTYGTHTVRVANKSTPSECDETGFSQTACGFVVEFTDMITTHRMNQYTSIITNGDGNVGGWKYSDMRAFLNNTIYAYENIDYSTTGIYSKLPSELRNAIIDTIVVSSHGNTEQNNLTTTDKLYLLSTMEVFGVSMDSLGNLTRQLDYYNDVGVSPSDFTEANKNYTWWLRSAYSDRNSFWQVFNYGSWSYGDPSNPDVGVSPAFRIG